MKKFIIAVKDNPVKWSVLAMFYLLLCWAMYQGLKNALSWYLIVLSCVLGGYFGSMAIVYFVDPILKYTDSKLELLFNTKKKTL